ncbi:MAG: hypothetical protein KBD16_00445 [Candidatus Pacebacteria bacterium]|nr:hypothetical protein [Candidatus Paceibacterota bacterium]
MTETEVEAVYSATVAAERQAVHNHDPRPSMTELPAARWEEVFELEAKEWGLRQTPGYQAYLVYLEKTKEERRQRGCAINRVRGLL